MRKLILILAMAMIAAAIPVVALADGGLKASDHDFTTGTSPTDVKADVGLCTFCHTPHKAMATRLLWNHTLSTATYTWDEDTTIGGTPLPTNFSTWAGPTKYCLSCHDGTIAIGDIAWFKQQAWPLGTGLFTGKHNSADDAASGIKIGPDMSKNHPVAVPYPRGTKSYNGITSGGTLGQVVDQWVDNPVALGIRIYVDDGSGKITIAGTDSGGVVTGNVGIECSSCHDPHNGPDTTNYFVRGSLTGSTVAAGQTGYICVKCHAK